MLSLSWIRARGQLLCYILRKKWRSSNPGFQSTKCLIEAHACVVRLRWQERFSFVRTAKPKDDVFRSAGEAAWRKNVATYSFTTFHYVAASCLSFTWMCLWFLMFIKEYWTCYAYIKMWYSIWNRYHLNLAHGDVMTWKCVPHYRSALLDLGEGNQWIQWIPSPKANNMKVWCFLCRGSKQAVTHNRIVGDSRRHDVRMMSLLWMCAYTMHFTIMHAGQAWLLFYLVWAYSYPNTPMLPYRIVPVSVEFER